MIIPVSQSSFNIQPVSAVTRVNTSGYSQSNSDQSSYSQPSASLSFSSSGIKLSQLMSRARSMDSEDLKSKIKDIRDQFDALDLETLDVSTMDREALEGMAADIESAIKGLSEDEDEKEQEAEYDDMTDQALTDLIATYSKRIDALEMGFDQLESMVGVVTLGGFFKGSQAAANNRIPSGYQVSSLSLKRVDEEISTTSLLEDLLRVWETGGDDTGIYQAVYDFLSQ